MKKIISIFLILLFLLLSVSLVYSYYKDIDENLTFYSIPKNYSIYKTNDKTISIDIYSNHSNSMISFTNNNRYQLIYNEHIVEVDDLSVSTRKEYLNKKESIYVYTYKIDISNFIGDVYKNTLFFKISNSKYTLNINAGEISIYNDEYKILNFKDLYGNYSYYNDELHLVGITIALSGEYNNLYSVSGGICNGNINYIIRDTLYPNEININDLDNMNLYETNYKGDYELSNKDRYYFIPICYEKLLLTLNPCFIFNIDDEEYINDNFYYLYNDIHLENYQYSKKAGELRYA